ncbi:MAG TPA: YisL family protein [Cerasibacillus sp.]|uniref:YisL family protein n=1 Tax=Cerasibacillus sp. TaxID=2498711 RepID=UPI002F3FA345
MNTHLHITSWVVAIILLIVVVMLHRAGNQKGAKISHMILRLFYIIILISGGLLVSEYFKFATGAMLGEVIGKTILGLWVIMAMEMIAVRMAKGRSAKGAWIQFVIAFLLTLVLGFGRLPYGVHLFG